MVSIKASIDTASLNKLVSNIQKLIEKNIKSSLKNYAFPELIRRIMVGFDNLADRADILPEDPTNPSNWREEFEAKLHEDLANTFIVEGNSIRVSLGEKSFLGYEPGEQNNDPDDKSPLHWMVYYLEGLAGDWAFISPETYEKLTGHDYEPGWGRFSEGFMMARKEYFKRGFDRTVPFEEVRHPFSGYSPLDIFTEAVREFRIGPYIKKALAAASRGEEL